MRLDAFEPVSLSEVSARAALQHRVDRKHIIHRAALGVLLDALAPTHRALEIAGRRAHAYDTVYFDSPGLGAYRAHLQGRRRRFKTRTRLYADSDVCVFEIKLKDARGLTVKQRLEIAPGEHATISARAKDFLDDCLRTSYGLAAPAVLEPTLHSRFTRLTLVGMDAEERLTCDLDVAYTAGGRALPGLDPSFVIVETKSLNGRGPAQDALKALGSRPASVSKYCLGIGLSRPDVHRGRFLAPVRRYLAASGD